MALPGHLWSVKDQYGAYWNDEPFPTYVHVWHFRRKLVHSFPEFHFTLVMAQRDPSRPLPFYYAALGEKREKENGNHIAHTTDPTTHQAEDF